MASNEVTLTREELYELVWSRPIMQLAPEFGLSGVGFSKMCARLEVPTPGRGYWARAASGQKEARPKLPKPNKGTRRGVRLSVLSEAEVATAKREKPAAPTIAVRDTLVGARPEVHALKKRLDQQRPDPTDGMKSLRGSWSMAAVRVSANAQSRMLRILDALLRGIIQRGLAIQFEEPKGPRDDTRLAAVCRGQVIGISLAERAARSPHVLTEEEKAHNKKYSVSLAPKFDYVGSGRLAIHLETLSTGARSSWSDSETHRLEDRLGDVIVGIELAADALNERDAEFEAERQRAAKALAKLQEAERRAEHVEALEKDLHEMAASWERSRRIGAFLDAVEGRMPTEGRTGRFVEWLAWARARAKEDDPLSKPSQLAKDLTLRT